ncbi:MAG: SusD/RagB family nutrient-binding outer membrane lipoprotein [Segetibacter sp.]
MWTNQNGISRAFLPGDGGQAKFLSKTLIDFLKGPNTASTTDDDPRLMVLSGGILDWSNEKTWKPINADPLAQKGMPNGKSQSQLEAIEGVIAPKVLNLDSTYSIINPLLLNRDEPYMLMNYGEVQLLLAEAAQRSIGGLSPGAAEAYYNAGVKASMQMYTIYDASPSFAVSDAAVAAYLAAYPYNVAKPALEMIGDQMWVNHFLNWWEAWSHWRRTGYPVLVPTNCPRKRNRWNYSAKAEISKCRSGRQSKF